MRTGTREIIAASRTPIQLDDTENMKGGRKTPNKFDMSSADVDEVDAPRNTIVGCKPTLTLGDLIKEKYMHPFRDEQARLNRGYKLTD